MKSKSRNLDCRLLLGIAGIVFAGGCGDSQGPSTVQATGLVTFAGKPVEGANVIFYPLAGAENAMASQSTTNAAGEFEMATHVGGGKYKPGIVAGKYTVAITKLDTAAISSTLAPPKNLLPAVYSNPDTSNLSADVVADRMNRFEFKLEAK